MKRMLLLLALALLALASPASAQTYPSRTVSVIVPYPAGGSVDVVARLLVQKLNESMGQSFIVENRAGGAGGAVGANAVAKAAPDGYTLMLTASIHIITPFLNSKIPYDAVKDFAPVSLVASGPLIVSTAPSVPAKNAEGTVRRSCARRRTNTPSRRRASARPGISRSSCSSATPASIRWSSPTRAPAPMLTDIMSGQIHLIADPMASSLPLAASGKIKALAVTSLKRVAAAPDIPTIEESGMTGFDFSLLVRPVGAEGPARRYRGEAAGRGRQGGGDGRRSRSGSASSASSRSDRRTAEFAKYIDEESAKYGQIIRDAKIKAE